MDQAKRVVKAITRALFDDPFEVCTMTKTTEGWNVLEDHRIDVIIADPRLVDLDGGELLKKIEKAHPTAVRIMLVETVQTGPALSAIIKAGFQKILVTPWNEMELKRAIYKVLEWKRILAGEVMSVSE